ncbi:MAG: ABC transporter permease, partial [Devosia sp.]|nr:ABC transporter permease [Devosia sp.]
MLLLIAVMAFILMHLIPGDPAVVIAGADAGPAAVERIRHELGLDRPLIEQLASWLYHLGTGDFGRSLVLNQTVISAVAERLPVTLSLALLSLVITLPIGVFLGILAAYFRGSW